MIYAFIRDHLSPDYPVRLCCRALGVSPSGYYHARGRPPSRRECRRAVLAEHVRAVHREARGVYGSPRVARALRLRGVAICRNTAARIMRENGLRSRRCPRFRPRTTDSSGTLRPAPNLLRRGAGRTRRSIWVADITYIPLEKGFAYLAAVMDLRSRRIVGWALADSLRTELATAALTAAVRRWKPGRGTIHHSDRGAQYDSRSYRRLLREHGLVQSMSRRGDCYDNAAMESFFATLKTELVRDARFPDLPTARDEIFAFIEGFYHRLRLHSALGYSTPLQIHPDTI